MIHPDVSVDLDFAVVGFEHTDEKVGMGPVPTD